MKTNHYVLGIVQNPYPVVSLICADSAGNPAWQKMQSRTYADRTDIPSKKRKPAKTLVETIDPRGISGHYYAASVEVVDATPRTYDEAIAVALRFTPGNHISLPDWFAPVRDGKFAQLAGL